MPDPVRASPSPVLTREPPARAPEAGGAEDKILSAVEANDVDSLRQMLDPRSEHTPAFCTERYARGGARGTLLCHAVYNHRKRAATYLLNLPGTDIAKSEAIFFCVRHCKYDMALFLLAKADASAVNHQRATDGNSVLHCCCARPKPPVHFVSELCRLKRLNVNSRNHAGHSPVHLLALHSKGVEGRDVATLLRAKGALLDARTEEGVTALEICKNSFLREVLSLGSNSSTRQDPSQMLTEEDKERLNNTPSEKIHMQIDKLLKEASMAKEQLREEAYQQQQGEMEASASGRRRPKKLQTEEVDGLVSRLYSQEKEREKERQDKMRRRLDEDRKGAKMKKFDDGGEQEASVDRLFGEAMEKRKEKLDELLAKYTEAPSDAKSLSPEDLQESIGRLYSQSLDKSKEKHTALRKKYLEANLVNKKFGGSKMDKEAAAASVGRLYDGAKEKQAATLAAMQAKYLVSSPKRVLTEKEKQAVTERLAAAK